MTMKKDPN